MNIFGGGGMFDLMQHAQGIKTKFAAMKVELENLRLSEKSEDGLIQIELSGSGKVLSVTIAPELCVPERKEELQASMRATMESAVERTKSEAYRRLKEAIGPLAGMLGDLPI